MPAPTLRLVEPAMPPCTPFHCKQLQRSAGGGLLIAQRSARHGEIKLYFLMSFTDSTAVVVFAYAKNAWTEFSTIAGLEVPGFDSYAPQLMEHLAKRMGIKAGTQILERIGSGYIGERRFLGFVGDHVNCNMGDQSWLDLWGRLVEFRIPGLDEEMERFVRMRIRDKFVREVYEV